jgi:hypothetical protein
LNASEELLAEPSAFPEFKRNIGSDTFKADHEVETDGWYSRITPRKSLSFFMTTFSASLTNIRSSYLSHLIAATM